MTENIAPEQVDALVARAQRTEQRIAALGIPKQELAQLAGIDRGTLGRALKADPATLKNGGRTWVKIERALATVEEQFPHLVVGGGEETPSAMTASGESIVVSTVEYAGARITLQGKAEAVAEAIRRVLAGDA